MLSSNNFDELVKSRHYGGNGVQRICNYLKKQDSGWSLPRTAIRGRNDRITHFQTFCETINFRENNNDSIPSGGFTWLYNKRMDEEDHGVLGLRERVRKPVWAKSRAR